MKKLKINKSILNKKTKYVLVRECTVMAALGITFAASCFSTFIDTQNKSLQKNEESENKTSVSVEENTSPKYFVGNSKINTVEKNYKVIKLETHLGMYSDMYLEKYLGPHQDQVELSKLSGLSELEPYIDLDQKRFIMPHNALKVIKEHNVLLQRDYYIQSELTSQKLKIKK